MDPDGSEQLSKDFVIRMGSDILHFAVHQRDRKILSTGLLQGTNRQESVVDSPQFVARDDYHLAVQSGDQVQHGVAFTERNQETARAFDEELKIFDF